MTSDEGIDAALEQALELGELGVQVAAYQDGELIIDQWIGVADDTTGRLVDDRTLFPVFSVTKAVVATAVHLEAERGHLDINAPVAAYWPEYASKRKEAITIKHVLEHTAAVPQMPADLTADRLGDWDGIVKWLAGVEPLCEPGTRSIYHAVSFGYILGEVIRRTDPDHRLFGEYARAELCAPLGIEDLWVGLPPEQEARVARLSWGARPPQAPATRVPMRELAMPIGITPDPQIWNSPAAHQACVPAMGGIMTARDGARFFNMLALGGEVDGRRLLSRDRLLAQTAHRADPLMVDEGLGTICPIGVGGYWLSGYGLPEGNDGVPRRDDPVVDQGPHVLVLNGAGGSIGWANLDTGLSAVITHNRMFLGYDPGMHPFSALGNAIRAVAGVDSPR
jgi:CubicO group peptidase (beta-lactamase class C family)